jgi:hypothetical protein
MKILGISPEHDSSTCLLEDGIIKYFMKEERITRVKRDHYPVRTVSELVKDNDIDYIAWCSPSKNDGTFIKMGEFDGIIKSPANINTNYNLALAGVTIADGFWHFNDRFCTFGSVNVDGVMRDLEKEFVQNNNSPTSLFPGSVTAYLRGQFYKILPSMVWLGVNQYSALAIWHAHLQRDIIEDTTHDWFTPDFIYNNNERIGKFKEIPYNLQFKEPTDQAK